ncbi:MAG TPA: hypothetical protein DHW82_06175 [Spirochaetia bacterium]|nr:MAG: hypothetical protein A2Y41_09945 [Spirochaetes bacterium GWB1_36_13]HCL56579.1 hypothetical protein [Spirochaetia bacterium]
MADETVYKRSPNAKVLSDSVPTKSVKLSFKDKSVDITKKIYIGRNPDNDITLENDPLVSRKHALVEIIGEICYIRDLNSTNNTYVNGNPLQKGETKELQGGDVIKIGKTEFTIFK